MRKFRSLIAAVMVVVIQITPGPFGLRPAHAAIPLAVVAVGGIIAASGVMVAGAGVYKPPTFDQANAAVDSITGDISRKVIVARMFGEGATTGLRGFQSQYTLDFPKAYEWIKANLPSFPSLGPAATAATLQTPIVSPAVNDVFAGTSGNRKILTVGAVTRTGGFYAYPGEDVFAALKRFYATAAPVEIGGQRLTNTGYTFLVFGPYEDGYVVASSGNRLCYASTCPITTAATTDSVYPVPNTYADPKRFAAAYPNTEAGQDETDRIAVQNPSAIKSMPQAITPEQYAEAAKQAAAEMAQANADIAQALADAHPEDASLQAAANAAQSLADQAKNDANVEEAKLETIKETPDIPYNPSGLSGPYTLPEVDFAERLRQFNNSLKGSSIFSLPNAVLGNVPDSATSTMTIQGGQIFGTHVFDFADLAGMWVVLRGIVITAFSFIAVRVVTLKK
jgi:hypothetical protein